MSEIHFDQVCWSVLLLYEMHQMEFKYKQWQTKINRMLNKSLGNTPWNNYTITTEVRSGNSSAAEEVSRFQRLFHNLSWLVWGKASRHQKLAPTFPWRDNCLMVTERDFSQNGSITMTKREIPSVAEGWLLSTLCCWEAAVYTLEKSWKKLMLSWWWWTIE